MAAGAASESQLQTVQDIKESFFVQLAFFVATIKLALTNEPFFIHSPFSNIVMPEKRYNLYGT